MKEKKLTKWSIFINAIFWRPLLKIQLFLNDLKNRCARFFRGYSMYDVSEIDTWFVGNIIPMLKTFKQKIIWGVPTGITEQKFNKILDEMIEGFEEVKKYKEEYCIFDDEWEQFSEKEKEHWKDVTTVSRKKYDRAFKLFHKYIHCLSD